MPKKKRYGDLKKEQRIQLKRLIRAIAELPTPNLLSECSRLRGVDVGTEEGRAESDRVFASVMAYEKLQPYLMALRYFSGERESIGRQIYDYIQVPYPTKESEVEAKVFADLLAADQAGVQEVAFHYFSLTVKHVLSYLNLASATVVHVLSEEDYEYLDHYRDLRDHYEHFYNRLPGRVHEATLVTKTISEFGYRVRAGLEVDAQGHIRLKVQKQDANGKKVVDEDGNPVLIEKPIDVTSKGMTKIEEIVQRNWREIRKKAIDGLREHFLQNPESIPSPDDVQFELMTSPGGYSPEQDKGDHH